MPCWAEKCFSASQPDERSDRRMTGTETRPAGVLMSGVLWSSVGDIGQRFFSFLVMIILVRLLSLQEFGTAATAAMLIQLIQPIARFGIFDYLIQKHDLDEPTKSAAVLGSMALGAIAAMLVFFTSGLVAWAFSDDALIGVLRLLSLMFVINAVGVVYEALLVKQFGFKSLAVRNISAVVVAGSVAILAAFCGWGVYSLVVQQLVFSLISTIVLCLSLRWRPVLTGAFRRLPTVMNLGSRYTIAQIFTSLNNTIYGLAIGLLVGTEAAGIFRLAWSGLDLCIQLTVRPFLKVAQPTFAQLKLDREALKTSLITIMRFCALLTFPVFGVMAAVGPELGTFVYGQKWLAAGKVLSILCLVVFCATPNYLIAILLNAVGQPGKALVLSVVQCVLSVGLALLAAPFGLAGMAIAFVIRPFVTTPLSFRFARVCSGVTTREIGQALVVPIAATVLGAVIGLAVKIFVVADWHPILVISSVASVIILIYLPAVLMLDRELALSALERLRSRLAKSGAVS